MMAMSGDGPGEQVVGQVGVWGEEWMGEQDGRMGGGGTKLTLIAFLNRRLQFDAGADFASVCRRRA